MRHMDFTYSQREKRSHPIKWPRLQKRKAEREIPGDSMRKEKGRTGKKEESLQETSREEWRMGEDDLEWQLPEPQEGLSPHHCP